MNELSETALSAVGVRQQFDVQPKPVIVLHDISLSLQRGEFSALMGESGSGKSTLLAILSGLLRPTQGQVSVFGENLWAMSEVEREAFRLRHFGFIFQGFHLFPALTAVQQLEIVLRWGENTSRREARDRACDMLKTLGLEHGFRKRPAQLSGGEKQRVAIGRALVKHPALCFADEPTSALDGKTAHRVMQVFRDAADQVGSTVFVITHDKRMTVYADRTLWLEDGVLQAENVETRIPNDESNIYHPTTEPVAVS